MKLELDKIGNKSQVILVSLVILTIFVGLSCASAASVDANACNGIKAKSDVLTMTVKYNSGIGAHWEVAPETHGVTFMSKKFIPDHPDASGSSGTLKYSFLKQSQDYYVKLVLIDSSGKIIKVVDSDMLN